MIVDMPLSELREYRPPLRVPSDLEAFWATTLAQSRRHELEATFRPLESTALRTVDAYDVTFRGFDGQKVAGWLLLPSQLPRPLPAVVEYLGYGDGRGTPHERLDWSAFGFAHFIMDTRGQGGMWRAGATDDEPGAVPPHAPGFLTAGLPDPQRYYYRRLYVDAVRAVDAVRTHPDVDPDRIAVMGESQGGGLAIAAGVLARGVRAVLADVPFLSHFERALDLARAEPMLELLHWCRAHTDLAEQALDALSYFDVAVLGAHATAPALFSVALRDEICPPSTVFAAFNHYAGEAEDVRREIRVWPYSGHEGGAKRQRAEQVEWLAAL